MMSHLTGEKFFSCSFRSRRTCVKLAMTGIVLFTTLTYSATPVDDSDISRWKAFSSKAGWSIKYPASWKVGSCRQCPDPTDSDVFVTFLDPSTMESIMIEHLIDKRAEQTAEQWLTAVKRTTNLNPSVSEEWIFVDGEHALKVKNKNPDSGESENIYLCNGSKTFAIRASNIRNVSFYTRYQQMVSLFRFITQRE